MSCLSLLCSARARAHTHTRDAHAVCTWLIASLLSRQELFSTHSLPLAHLLYLDFSYMRGFLLPSGMFNCNIISFLSRLATVYRYIMIGFAVCICILSQKGFNKITALVFIIGSLCSGPPTYALVLLCRSIACPHISTLTSKHTSTWRASIHIGV